MDAPGFHETFDPVGDGTPRLARRAASDFASRHVRDDHTLAAIALCVSEAVSNVVIHAYRGVEPGPAIVKGWIDGDALCIAVCDRGMGLMPRLRSPGFGIGLPVMAQIASKVDIETRADGGTEVRMRFAIA